MRSRNGDYAANTVYLIGTRRATKHPVIISTAVRRPGGLIYEPFRDSGKNFSVLVWETAKHRCPDLEEQGFPGVTRNSAH